MLKEKKRRACNLGDVVSSTHGGGRELHTALILSSSRVFNTCSSLAHVTHFSHTSRLGSSRAVTATSLGTFSATWFPVKEHVPHAGHRSTYVTPQANRT